MNLSIQRETILNPLQLVIGVVERRQTLPILANVLLIAENDSLSVTATDLEIELIGKSVLEQPLTEKIAFTVPGRKLLDICRTLPENARIDLQKDKERLVLRSGRSRFVLATLPVESFPTFESNKANMELSLEQKNLNALLNRTHFAMAQQDVRFYLNGMMFQVNANTLRTVATDGHRFAMHNFPSSNPGTAQVILPRKAVLELMRLLKNDEQPLLTSIGDNHVRVQGSDFTFTSKLIDGRFPDYEHVLPKNFEKSVVVDRDAFREALVRVSVLSNEKFRAIRLHLRNNLLHILANNPEQEEAEEILTVDYAGEDLDIAFNVTYLMDILNTMAAGDVKLTFLDSNSSMFMEEVAENHSLYLVMPIQL